MVEEASNESNWGWDEAYFPSSLWSIYLQPMRDLSSYLKELESELNSLLSPPGDVADVDNALVTHDDQEDLPFPSFIDPGLLTISPEYGFDSQDSYPIPNDGNDFFNDGSDVEADSNHQVKIPHSDNSLTKNSPNLLSPDTSYSSYNTIADANHQNQSTGTAAVPLQSYQAMDSQGPLTQSSAKDSTAVSSALQHSISTADNAAINTNSRLGGGLYNGTSTTCDDNQSAGLDNSNNLTNGVGDAGPDEQSTNISDHTSPHSDLSNMTNDGYGDIVDADAQDFSGPGHDTGNSHATGDADISNNHDTHSHANIVFSNDNQDEVDEQMTDEENVEPSGIDLICAKLAAFHVGGQREHFEEWERKPVCFIRPILPVALCSKRKSFLGRAFRCPCLVWQPGTSKCFLDLENKMSQRLIDIIQWRQARGIWSCTGCYFAAVPSKRLCDGCRHKGAVMREQRRLRLLAEAEEAATQAAAEAEAAAAAVEAADNNHQAQGVEGQAYGHGYAQTQDVGRYQYQQYDFPAQDVGGNQLQQAQDFHFGGNQFPQYGYQAQHAFGNHLGQPNLLGQHANGNQVQQHYPQDRFGAGNPIQQHNLQAQKHSDYGYPDGPQMNQGLGNPHGQAPVFGGEYAYF